MEGDRLTYLLTYLPTPLHEQEPQLSQRQRTTLRVIEYFVKSLKVIRMACLSPY